MKQIWYQVGMLLGIYQNKDFVKASQIINKAIDKFNTIRTKWDQNPSFRSVRGDSPGLCEVLGKSFRYYGVYVTHGSEIHKVLHKFNPGFLNAKYDHTNLIEHPFYYGSPCYGEFWWGKKDRQSRLDALNKLREYYIKHDKLIKKPKKTQSSTE